MKKLFWLKKNPSQYRKVFRQWWNPYTFQILRFALSDAASTEDDYGQWCQVERAGVQRTGTGLIGALYFNYLP